MKQFIAFLTKSTKRFFTSLLTYVILISLILIQPTSSYAAYGGRIGGSNFNAPSRGNSFSQNYGEYGGRYQGGGIGFPFLLPIFGFGGGGLFGFLILITISGIIAKTLRNGTNSEKSNLAIDDKKQFSDSVKIVQMQIGLLAGAKEIQEDLKELAKSSDTSSTKGLQKVLQDTTLTLLRYPEFWVYANWETGNVPYQTSESAFNRLSITERSKLKGEAISNFGGTPNTTLNSSQKKTPEINPINEFIVITILVASKKQFSLNESINNKLLKETLSTLGSMTSEELLALEIIWQPVNETESLSAEELVTSYPNLKYL